MILSLFVKGVVMKRFLFLLLLLGLLLAPAFAQFVDQSYPFSLENGLTAGTFFNEIDQSFQVTADFGAYNHGLLFAGLGNPASGLGAYNEERAWDTSLLNSTLRAGYYMIKPFPLSVYTHMQLSRLTARTNPGVFITEDWQNHLVSSNTVQWSRETVTKKTPGLAFIKDYELGLQGIMKLGPGVLGVYLGIAADNGLTDNAAAPAAFADTVHSFRVNLSNSGDPLDVKEDYTRSIMLKNYDLANAASGGFSRTNTFSLLVPYAMRIGSMEHRFYADLGLDLFDNSSEYSVVESAHRETAGGVANADSEGFIKDSSSLFGMALGYGIIIPTGDKGDLWKAGARIGLAIGSSKFESEAIERLYDLSTTGSKTGVAGGTRGSVEKTYKATVYTDFNLNGSRLFNYQVAGGVNFRLEPGLGLSIAGGQIDGDNLPLRGFEAIIETTGSVTLGANGSPTNDPYIVLSTERTGKETSEIRFGIALEAPMGLELKPEGWKFGILMGARPRLDFVIRGETSASVHQKGSGKSITGGSVVQGPYTIQEAAPANTSWSFIPLLSESHYIGITVPFAGGARLDARINGNLLEFENFAIQAVIPLN